MRFVETTHEGPCIQDLVTSSPKRLKLRALRLPAPQLQRTAETLAPQCTGQPLSRGAADPPGYPTVTSMVHFNLSRVAIPTRYGGQGTDSSPQPRPTALARLFRRSWSLQTKSFAMSVRYLGSPGREMNSL
jgi:hypothetical protein